MSNLVISYPENKRVCSLQEYCLHAIANDLDAIFSASKSKNPNLLDTSVKFVQRVYSSQLFNKLKNSGRLKSEHLDLLINPYTKELDLNGIDVRLIDSLVDSLQTYGKDIVSLKVGLLDIEANLYTELISSMPNLHYIEIGDERIRHIIEDDEKYVPYEVFEEIGRSCRLIKELKLYCVVDNVILINIFANSAGIYENRSSLEYFEFDVSYEELDPGISFLLNHAPMLKVLRCRDIGGVIYDKHRYDTSSKIYGLTFISFINVDTYLLSEVIKVCTERCPSVSTVHVNFARNSSAIERIADFQQMVELKVSEVTSQSDLDQFLRLVGHRLKRLALMSCSVTVETLVKFCPNLEFLDINLSNFKICSQDPSALPLPKLLYLKTLIVGFDDFINYTKVTSLKRICQAAECLKELVFDTCTEVDQILDPSVINLNSVEKIFIRAVPYVDKTVLMDLVSKGNLSLLHLEYCSTATYDVYTKLLEICREKKAGTYIFCSEEYDDSVLSNF